MSYPTITDYNLALQNPNRAFTVDDLRAARFELDQHGMPLGSAGNTAVVYKATVGDREEAVRLFLRQDASSRRRYSAMSPYLSAGGTAHFLTPSEWVDDAITVNGVSLPVVRMRWVTGRTLDNHVDHLVQAGETSGIGRLAESWRSMVAEMQGSGFAHGDLQHGNVLITTRGEIRLVDFDSAWVTQLAAQAPPPESGHPNYQRQNRVWGPWMDTFPGLVIYMSLLWLSRTIEPWRSLYNGENLLFTERDFRQPFLTQAWEEVAAVDDLQVGALAERLRRCCEPRWSSRGPLEQLLPTAGNWWEQLPGAGPTTTTPPRDRARESTLPPPDPDWWKTTTGTSGQGSPKAKPHPERTEPVPTSAAASGSRLSAAGRTALVLIITLIGALVGGSVAAGFANYSSANVAFAGGAAGLGLLCLLVLLLLLTRRR